VQSQFGIYFTNRKTQLNILIVVPSIFNHERNIQQTDKLTVLKFQSVPTPEPALWKKTHQKHKKNPMAVRCSCAPDDGCK
jgi:hypothetical protein